MQYLGVTKFKTIHARFDLVSLNIRCADTELF